MAGCVLSYGVIHFKITVTVLGDVYKLLNSSICSFFQDPVLCPDILFSIMCSNNHNLCCFLNENFALEQAMKAQRGIEV
jgi:hypothetical protein